MTLHRFMIGFGAFCAMALPAVAQTWQAAPPTGAKLGLKAIGCKGEFCLAVACVGGKPQLVSLSPGGGPFNGATKVTVGPASASVTFVEDPKIMDAFNMLGTRAPVMPELIADMATAKDITLAGPTFSDKVTSRFLLNGYAKLAPAIARDCGIKGSGSQPAGE
ncbi:MAG TPA: hypothetical protein PLQ11_04395 [Beijerinckiaceae bacterium]|nr:hypothetical protein [Beijerinckiaceae bacterium]